jgi:hypothetical protein
VRQPLHGRGFAALQALGERPALDVLHDQVRPLAGVEVVNGDEIRVLEASGELCLAAKALFERRIAGHGVGDRLHRHRPA